MNQHEWEQSVELVGIVAGCLVEKDGKYLLVQEKQQKIYGLWNLPAGYVDKGEQIADAAKREVLEETGYKIKVHDEIDIFHESVGRPVKHIFKAEISGGELNKQNDEILDVRWLSFDEIERLKDDNQLRAPWIWDLISKAQTR